MNTKEPAAVFWNIYTELRKEVLLAQEIRSKIIALKITAVSAGIGLIYANIGKVDSNLLLVPAIASVFFDLLINSYSISIKRIGFYCKFFIEPNLLPEKSLPERFIYWEDFVSQKELKQLFSMLGNLGLTGIIIVIALGGGIETLPVYLRITVTLVLSILFIMDIYAHCYPAKKLNKLRVEQFTKSKTISA